MHMRLVAAILIGLLVAPTGVFGQEVVPAAANAPRLQRYDRGKRAPDAAMVQRVATTLGVGEKVDVTTTGSKKLRAKIQFIDATNFTVTHGSPPVPLVIAYDDVTQLKRAGWPLGVKIGVASGAAFGAALLIWIITYINCACS
jgi:hypothetical protein